MTEVVDHKAEALRLLRSLEEPDAPGAEDARSWLVTQWALVHSNLAIAEGQERASFEEADRLLRKARAEREELREAWRIKGKR